jgi:hypothetical protein
VYVVNALSKPPSEPVAVTR